MKLLKLKDNQDGFLIILFLIVLPFLIAIATYYSSEALTSFQVARFDQLHTEAQLAADAGADYGIEQLAVNNNWSGTGSEITLHNGQNIRTTFFDTVTNGSNSKTIAVIGRTYWPASSTTASRSVSIYVDLYPVTSGNFSVVAGSGGLYMSNSAKIPSGNVFINGEIRMSNNAQIGLSTNPVTVQVADDICPTTSPYTNYPEVCTSGNPITITNSAHIYGNVTATNQTSGNGMSNSGLQAGSVTPMALPTYNRSAQQSAVTTTLSGSAASCSGESHVIWPANSEITGNVTLSNSCSVDVLGNVWITGNLNVSNSSQIEVDNSVGTNRPVIMIDGSSGANFGNGASITPNSDNTGVEVITFYSTASCSPNCTSVSGADLHNSRTISTINMSNNFSAADTILYAYWTQVNMSNSGQVGAIIGQTISMSNNAAITFGNSSSGIGSTTWMVKGYRRN